MNANIERIDNNSVDVKEQLPQTEAALIALLFNRIEAYQEALKDEEDKISHLREQLDKAQKELLAYKVGRRRTLDITNEPAKFKRELEDQINRIQKYWLEN